MHNLSLAGSESHSRGMQTAAAAVRADRHAVPNLYRVRTGTQVQGCAAPARSKDAATVLDNYLHRKIDNY